MSPFRAVFGKPCHLRIELEHGVMGAIKTLSIDLEAVGGREEVIVE